jgi:hypothetical protein
VTEIFYPVDRLFANPRIFFAIANALEGPDADTLKNAFYELMEYTFSDYEEPEEIEFEADEICFSIEPESGDVQITLNTGKNGISPNDSSSWEIESDFI